MKSKWKHIPRWLRIFLVTFFLLLVFSEVILRFVVGLGDLALYREDKNYEYFFEANQDVWRLGNHIVTNEFGMRSKKVNKKKKLTILEFGDSVLNGGAHVDQDELASSIEEKELNEKFNDEIQILNISAQSWGVSNAFAFLNSHGDFNAKMIILVFSSHDLNDNMHFKKVVGVQRAWPNEKPLLAITDAWSRFIWPGIKGLFIASDEYDYLKNFNDSKINPGWKEFTEYSQINEIKLLVYLHASQTEIEAGDYNEKGKGIIRICKKNGIELIKDLNAFDNPKEAFIDDIHMNATGHSVMAELINRKLERLIPSFL